MKRVGDLVISTALLVLLAPLMALVVLAVRLTSPGPAVFQQLRVGLNLRGDSRDRRGGGYDYLHSAAAEDKRKGRRDRRRRRAYGRPFVLYKFRTMQVDAEKNGAQFAKQNDPRVTPLGRFLRKTRLDELPQLWNVLRGEMSLVGPRPERPEFVGQLSEQIPNYLNRLGLRPGLSGVAQIVNGYDNDIESFRRKVAYDLLYLQNCSLRNDAKILIRTIGTVVTGRGAL
jgi:lipopolysaccharide/colanic/teichoic acid biosynthesis glycosyltransferase